MYFIVRGGEGVQEYSDLQFLLFSSVLFLAGAAVIGFLVLYLIYQSINNRRGESIGLTRK